MIKAYAALKKGDALEAFEYDPGALGAHEIEIDVRYCGICHSDLSMLQNDWGLTQYPFVPGHEIVGTVAAVGKGVRTHTPGQLVGVGWHAGYCMSCAQCMTGDHNLCSDATGTIIAHHGGFADKVRAQAASVIPLPEGIDLASAGPLFCGGATVFSPMLHYNVKPTDRVGVVGIGGLGHMALKFLSAWGCEVTAFTSSESKVEEALSMGAHRTINSRDSDAIKAAAGYFNYIITTVNVTLDWEAYLAALAAKGRLVCVGAALEPMGIQAFSLIMRQRSVSGSVVGSPHTIATMLDFAKRHNIQPKVEIFPFDKVNDALARLKEGKAHYRIVLSRE